LRISIIGIRWFRFVEKAGAKSKEEDTYMYSEGEDTYMFRWFRVVEKAGSVVNQHQN